jgi:signal peptidase I
VARLCAHPSNTSHYLMRTPGRRPLRRVIVASLVALCVGVLAAVHLTGPLSGVIVVGDSMTPWIQPGDFVILRQSSSYAAGDVVAYQQPDVGLVLHRIVDRDDGKLAQAMGLSPGERFVLKGDNKPALDSYRPLAEEIRGRELTHIPGGGNLISRIRQPAVIAVIFPLACIFSFFSFTRRPDRHRRARMRLPGGTRLPSGVQPSGVVNTGAALLLVALLAASALAVFFVVGSTEQLAVKHQYDHLMKFSYRAAGAPDVYDRGFAQSGDPVYLVLADRVTVRFDYRLDAEQRAEVAGTARLSARLSMANGWTRTLPEISTTTFADTTALEGDVDLTEVRRLLQNLEDRTEVDGESYRLTVLAEVDTTVHLAGQQFPGQVRGELDFAGDSKQLQLIPKAGGGDALVHVQPGMIQVPQTRDRMLGPAVLQFSVTRARVIAYAALGGALGGMLVMGLLMLFAPHRDEVARIRARYGYLLLPVTLHQTPRETALALVPAFTDLVKLAETEGVRILDEDSVQGHRFLVVGRDITYVYDGTSQPDQPGEREQPSQPRAA